MVKPNGTYDIASVFSFYDLNAVFTFCEEYFRLAKHNLARSKLPISLFHSLLYYYCHIYVQLMKPGALR